MSDVADEVDALAQIDDDVSRRVFVQRVSFMGGVVLLGSACKDEPKKEVAPIAAVKSAPPTTKHQTFTNQEFEIVTAAVARLIPKDEDPGAVEANVPEFIDAILQTPQLSQMKDQLVPGVMALDRRAQRLFKVGFIAATPAQQDEVLTIFKNSGERTGESKFYEYLLVLTLEGFLGDPTYGGNKDQVGWRLVGFKLVDHTVGDPRSGYNGIKALNALKCGGGKGC